LQRGTSVAHRPAAWLVGAIVSWSRGQHVAYTVLFSQVAGLAVQKDINYHRKLVIL